MDQLINLVSEKTGLSEDMAKSAVDVVLGYLKDKLPAPIASQIDTVLAGETDAASGMMSKGLGGIFGQK